MTADADAWALSSRHHHGGVPPEVIAVAVLDLLVAGEFWLRVEVDRVDVGGSHHARQLEAAAACVVKDGGDDAFGVLFTACLDERIDGFDPLRPLLGVIVIVATEGGLRCGHGHELPWVEAAAGGSGRWDGSTCLTRSGRFLAL